MQIKLLLTEGYFESHPERCHSFCQHPAEQKMPKSEEIFIKWCKYPKMEVIERTRPLTPANPPSSVVGTVLSFHFRQCNNTTFLRGHSGTTFRIFTKFSAFVIVIRNNSEPPLFRSGSLFCICLALAKTVAIPYNKLLLMHKQQGKRSHDG